MLARTEFKLRFFGSVLGYVWTLMRPLLLFGVLWIFFTKVGHVNKGKGPGEQYYAGAAARIDRALHLLCGSDRGVDPQRGRSREPRAQDPLPAPGDPAVGSRYWRSSTWS